MTWLTNTASYTPLSQAIQQMIVHLELVKAIEYKNEEMNQIWHV